MGSSVKPVWSYLVRFPVGRGAIWKQTRVCGAGRCGASHAVKESALFTPSLSTLRRRAARQGYRIWKVRRGTPLSWEYGPYTLINNNMVALRGVGLEELSAFLDCPAERREAV